jgi:hypothetical protein
VVLLLSFDAAGAPLFALPMLQEVRAMKMEVAVDTCSRYALLSFLSKV